MTHISFGVHSSGRLMDAASVERGLACQCVCAECGERLVACQGRIKAPYFAHYSRADCPGAQEGALHLAAKQVILDAKRLVLPGLPVQVLIWNQRYGEHFRANAYIQEPREWSLPDAAAEVVASRLRFDVAGTDPLMGTVAVEVRVWHKVDERKAGEIASLQIPCVEVDLRHLLDSHLTMAALTESVLEQVEHKKWIFHPQAAAAEAALKSQYPAWLDRQAALQAERELEKQKSLARAERLEAQRRALFEQRVEAGVQSVSDSLGLPRHAWPRYVRLPDLNGARPFIVRGDLWRGLLYSGWIKGRPSSSLANVPLPSPSLIAARIADQLGASSYPERYDSRSATYAVKSYLRYLTACGMLDSTPEGLLVASDRPAKRRG